MVWFLASKGRAGLNEVMTACISSSNNVDMTFIGTFGGFKSLAISASANPSVTSQLKEALRVQT